VTGSRSMVMITILVMLDDWRLRLGVDISLSKLGFSDASGLVKSVSRVSSTFGVHIYPG
jgi:hypothetical protein